MYPTHAEYATRSLTQGKVTLEYGVHAGVKPRTPHMLSMLQDLSLKVR